MVVPQRYPPEPFTKPNGWLDIAKNGVAMKTLSVDRPGSFRRGNHVFPVITNDKTLTEPVGPESCIMFDVLDWLFKPVDVWINSKPNKGVLHSLMVRAVSSIA